MCVSKRGTIREEVRDSERVKGRESPRRIRASVEIGPADDSIGYKSKEISGW